MKDSVSVPMKSQKLYKTIYMSSVKSRKLVYQKNSSWAEKKHKVLQICMVYKARSAYNYVYELNESKVL